MKMKQFRCLRCGDCCAAKYSGNNIGHIPIYLDEIQNLIEKSKKFEKNIKIEPGFVYADNLNKQLIIATFEMSIKGKCEFYDDGCIIYNDRPITCKAYPIMTFHLDGNRKLFYMNNSCRFVLQNPTLYDYKYSELVEIFKEEYKYAQELLIKIKDIQFKILQLETDGIIDIGYLKNDKELYGLELKDFEDFRYENWPKVKLTDLKI